MDSEAGIVLGVMAYFVALTALLGLSGFTGQQVEFLAEPEFATTEERTISAATCLAKPAGLIPVFGTIHTLQCLTANYADLVPVIGPALSFTTNVVAFFFQIASFQTELHPAATAVIVGPPAVVLGYIGLRLLRGGG